MTSETQHRRSPRDNLGASKGITMIRRTTELKTKPVLIVDDNRWEKMLKTLLLSKTALRIAKEQQMHIDIQSIATKEIKEELP